MGSCAGRSNSDWWRRWGKPVDLQCTVNPELLGGLQVRVGDTVFDGSLDNRLDKMRAEMLESHHAIDS